MKKILLLSLALTTCLFSFSQQRTPVSKKLKSKSVKANFKTVAINDQIVEKPVNYSTAAKGATEINETQIGDTYYDLQTNSLLSNRIHLYDDGTIGAVWTRGIENPPSCPDRGTGYNYFNGTDWGPMPTARVESMRTGWPSYAPWGANGELFIAHGPDEGLLLAKRATKGTGEWTESFIPGPEGHENLLWPRAVTSGIDHNTIHCIALTEPSANGGSPYLGQDGTLIYNRSTDGGATWDIENANFEDLGSDYYLDIGGDTYAFAEPHGNTLAFVVTEKWRDIVLMKSTDGGDNWTKTVIYEFPIPLYNFEEVLDTCYVCDGSASICLDNNDIAHVAFGINRVLVDDPSSGQYSYFPYVEGIGYWNENMPTWTDGDQYYALDPDALYESGNLIGWAQDVDGNGNPFDYVGDDYPITYRTMGISTMPNLIADDNGWIFLSYASTTEGFDNGEANYKHIWLRGYDGYQWGDFLDIDNSIAHTFHECVYPNLAQNTDADNIHLIYQADEFPGLALDGDHDYVNNFIYYVKVAKSDLINVGINNVNNTHLNVSQNYPNPFNGISKISVTTEKTSNISLEVSNMMGQKVFEIPTHKVNAGTHILEINAANLINGVYFYTVKAGNASITKKMIVK